MKNIEENIAYLRKKMPNVGDKYEMRDYYTDEQLKEISEYGFKYETFDFGIETVEFTRIS